MEISCRVYWPRQPRESPLFRLVEQHVEEFLRVYPQRFAKQHGPLRPVVERALHGFLKCGLLEHGFARLWCPECRRSVLVAFSCRGRSFCPSCEKKKQLLWAEWLREDVLAPVAHRHIVLTIPRLLRPLFRRRRQLLGELARAGPRPSRSSSAARVAPLRLVPGSSSPWPPRETSCSGIPTCTSSPPTVAECQTARGVPCRSGTACSS